MTSQIGLGLAALGRPEYINIRMNEVIDKSETIFKQNALKVLDFAYKNGIRYFDTAPSYGKGEQFLLDWYLHNRYENICLGTKWGYTYVANWQLGFDGSHEIKEHSIEKLNEQWQQSEKMLPALQIYQVHSATIESGVLENKEVLQRLFKIKKETGIKIGITTSGDNQKEIIERALKVIVEDVELFDSFQVTYNILAQDTFSVLKEAKHKNKTIIIKEALANGRIFPNMAYTHYDSLYISIKRLSEKYNVGADAIALRFVIDSLNPTIVLSGASNIGQLQENLKALRFRLRPSDIEKLKTNCITPYGYWQERNQLNWN